MNKEVIQRIGDMAGEIAKGYAERNVPQEQLSGGMSRNITDLIVNQIIKALSGAGIGGGGGGGRGGGRGGKGCGGAGKGCGGGGGGRGTGGGGGGGGGRGSCVY